MRTDANRRDERRGFRDNVNLNETMRVASTRWLEWVGIKTGECVATRTMCGNQNQGDIQKDKET